MTNIKPNIVRHTDKPWGFEEILETNPLYTVKRLYMKKNHQCSFQNHEKKQETVISLSGNLTVFLGDGEEIILSPGEVVTIVPFQKHRMITKEEDCLYLECSTSELDDVIRIEDDYGRK